MNTAAMTPSTRLTRLTRLTHLVVIVALLSAAIVAVSGESTATQLPSVQPPAMTVVQLPRVEVVGKRIAQPAVAIVQLPRVVITGRRVTDARPTVAQGRSTKPVASASASVTRG